MKKTKKYYILLTLITVTIGMMFLATYAYFTLNIIGSGNDNDITAFNEKMEITFTDTSNVSLINAYTGETITKTFTIENTADAPVYYDISFEDLTNNFADPEDLVYTLTSTNNGAYVSETIVPQTSDNKIATAININPGVTHSYSLTITFLRTEDDQSDNANKTFSAKISVTPTADTVAGGRVYTSNTLGYALINNNNPSSSESLDYSNINEESGLYFTNTSIDGTIVYFFRGDSALNNNVLFSGFCWKIVRTTEDFGIRLIYSGPAIDGACTGLTADNSIIDTKAYNEQNNYNTYIGYMYGSQASNTYEEEHTNTTNSVIKDALDNWYIENINTYNSYIADSYYCNNRKTKSFKLNSVVYGNLGYASNNTGYRSHNNLITNTPSYNCYNKNDIFTVENDKGNEKLTYPIGLLTSDEAAFAGLTENTNNTANFLNSGVTYWTMSPAYYNGNAYVEIIDENGQINSQSVSQTAGIRPVITLKQDTILISGNGSEETPYKIN